MAFIEVRDVTKTYKMGEVEIKAVDEIGFGIDKGEFVAWLVPQGLVRSAGQIKPSGRSSID